MLSASDAIKTYLDSNTVQMQPHVTAEWNYNLVYSPFATYAGTGKGISTEPLLNSSNWVTSGKTYVLNSYSGKVTSNFYSPAATQISVYPSSDYSDSTNFQGSATISLPIGSSVTKCYKVVFYAKSINNSVISLVTQGSSDGGQLNGSASVDIDNIDWTLVELKVGQRPTDSSFSKLNLTFDITNNNLSLDNPGAWGIIISHAKVYEITYFDYSYGNLWDTNKVFSWFRPGESYVRSGNSSTPDSDVLTQRSLTSLPSGWNNQAPCSSVTYSPRIIFKSGQNPIFKNGVLSPFSQYKYFVSEKTSGSTSIGATYAELISVNKIVLKFNISQSKPSLFQVTLSDSTTNGINTYAFDSSAINSAGVCILYWNGSSWTTNKWSWSPTGNSGMPHIDDNGNISMYVTNSSINGYKNIDSISVTQLASTPISNFISNYPAGSDTYQELQRMQVIEVSPRLELDMTNFIMEFDIKKEFDNNNTPLPISSISANSASVIFSNIPLTGTNNYPKSIFSTISNDPLFTSPLAGMLTKNVKIYLNYYLPTQSNTVIPAGVYYVDTWDNQDIKQTKASCFDAMKILQTIPVVDYVSESQTADKIFSNLLDFSGYTDYNYDELLAALSDNKQQIASNFFFADSTSKTIYTALQEAFLAYQIGAWVDEYGVMRFKNLNTILSNVTPTKVLSDSNVVLDTYNENIKTKIGKILMRYRSPQIKKSVGVGSNTSSITSILQQAPEIIWQQDTEDLVPFNLLRESIPNLSQNYYVVDQGSYNNMFLTNTVDHKGYCIIENEIMSSGNIEIMLTALDSQNRVIPGLNQLIYPSSADELNSAIGKFSNQPGVSGVQQQPTGKFMNVKRGLFGTHSKPHYVMTNDLGSSSSVYAQNFNTLSIPVNGTSITTIANPSISSNNLINMPTTGGNKTYVVARQVDDGYSTYSAKFKFPDKIDTAWAGIFFGMTGSSSLTGTSYYLEIGKGKDSNSNRTYSLKLFSVNSQGVSTALTKTMDITGLVNTDFSNEPNDPLYDIEFGQFINLKFVNGTRGNRAIYVNKNRIPLDRLNYLTDKNTGKYLHQSNWLLDTNYADGQNSANFPVSFKNSNFGFYACSVNTVSTTVQLSEVYATEAAIDSPQNYYFQTKEYLNAVVAGYNITEKSFFVQSRPQIFGLNYYDVQMAFSPSLGAEIFKASYSFPYYPNSNTAVTPKIMYVKEDSLNYSEVVSTGFRAKFAAVNNSNYAVYTKTDPSYTKLADAQLLIASRSPIVLTPQLTLEKIINPNLINEVIELQSDWIQSKESADSILKILATSSEPFSRDIIVEIFGNPLLQIGDVVKLSYKLKNIIDISFFVAGVSQVWASGGLRTTLTLNQLNYVGITRNSYKSAYPSSTNSIQNAPYISLVSPNTGTDKGGDTVTITGYNFGSSPVVTFGTTVADIISSTSTSIVVSSPTSSVDSTVQVSVVSNGIANTFVNSQGVKDGETKNLFTYTSSSNGVQDVTITSITQGAYDTYVQAYPITVNWTVTNTSGKNYNAYNLQIESVYNGLQSTEGFGTINDDGSHSFTTGAGLFLAGETGTAIITPYYIDGDGIINQGKPSDPFSFTITASNTLQGPTNISYTTSANSNGTYNVVFSFTKGDNSAATILFMDGIAGTNRINNGSSISWPGTSISVANLSAGTHSFYFYGYDGTHTATIVASAQNPISVSQSNTSNPNATGPQAPVVTYTPGSAYYLGSSLYYDVTFTLGYGANSNRVYVFKDPNGVHNDTTRVWNSGTSYWTATTIPVTQIPMGTHTFEFYAGDNSGIGTNKTIVSINSSGTTSGSTTSPQAPTTPVLAASSYPYSAGDLFVKVVVDSTVGGYYLYVNGKSYDNPISILTNTGGYYAIGTSGLNYQIGTTYSLTAKAYDKTKKYFSPESNAISVTVPDPKISLSIASNDTITWTCGDSSYFDSFAMALDDSKGLLKTYNVKKYGSNWQDVSDGYTLSTDGLTFTDDRITNGKYLNIFAAGSILLSLIPFKSGVKYSPIQTSGTITSANGVQLPTPPIIYKTGTAGATTFGWAGVTLNQGTVLGYQVELYSGTSTSGTLQTINSGATWNPPTDGYYTAGDAYYAFMRGKTALDFYTLATGRSYPLYVRVRVIFKIGIIEYQSAWSDISTSSSYGGGGGGNAIAM